MAYLTAQPPAAPLMQNLQCFGTELFWSVTLTDRIIYAPMDGPAFDHEVTTRTRALNRPDRYALRGGNGTHSATAIVKRHICSDGMSDAEFGLSLDLILQSRAGQVFLSGCCRLTGG